MLGKRAASEEPNVARSTPKRARRTSLCLPASIQQNLDQTDPLLNRPSLVVASQVSFSSSADAQLHLREAADCSRLRTSSAPLPNKPATDRPSIAPTRLTHENLKLWDTYHPLMAQSAVVSEASIASEPAKDIDRRQAAYGIFIHRGDIPETLQKHIDEIVMDMQKPTTPSAARLARNSRRARGMNEPQGKDLLARDLLFRTEIDDGEELIQVLPEVTLSRYWLPSAPNTWVDRQYGALEQPRPDHAVGYITQQDAHATDPRSKAALEPMEEDKVMRHALTSQLHFPFLTCQWKSQKSGEGHYHASLQGARDGAAIVRNLHDFYTTAQRSPSIVDTAHFSLTTDTDSAKLWVHWLENKPDGGADSHMGLIGQAFLRPMTHRDTSMVDMRKMLRNILNYSVTKRLDDIKAAIADLPLPPPRTRSPKRAQSKKSVYSTETTTSSTALAGNPLATAPKLDTQLPTPKSSSPPSKRLREE